MPFPYLRTNVHTQGQTQQVSKLTQNANPKNPFPSAGYAGSLNSTVVRKNSASKSLYVVFCPTQSHLPERPEGRPEQASRPEGRRCVSPARRAERRLSANKNQQRSVGNFQQSTKTWANRQKPKNLFTITNQQGAVLAKDVFVSNSPMSLIG